VGANVHYVSTSAKRRTREYLRVSEGDGASVEEQHEEHQRLAPGLGLLLGEPYSDLGSASRYARRGRRDFARLLDDLKHGTFDAELLLMWESSRGSRRVGEWVTLVELCEERGVHIRVTTHGREYDPANARDRRSLLEDAIDSEYESAKTSRRVTRAAAAAAAAGRPHGRAPWGYRRVYNPTTGRLGSQEADPQRAPLVEELYERLEKGHSLYAIAQDWNQRGVLTRSGKPFRMTGLRDLALNPAYAGLRAHNPGRRVGAARPAQHAHLTAATWPALVPLRRWHAVNALLTAPSRRTSRPGSGVHLLSMIALCDPCGGPLAAKTDRRNGTPRALYACHARGCIQVDKDELDEIAKTAILHYLADPSVYTQLGSTDRDDEELARARDAVAAVAAELRDLAAQVGAGRLSPTFAAAAEPGMRARLTAAQRREAELASPPALVGLMPPGADVAQRWQDAEMSTRRAVARLLFADTGPLGSLRVMRSPHPQRTVPVAERVAPLAAIS